jgi:hypothetical protein
MRFAVLCTRLVTRWPHIFTHAKLGMNLRMDCTALSSGALTDQLHRAAGAHTAMPKGKTSGATHGSKWFASASVGENNKNLKYTTNL